MLSNLKFYFFGTELTLYSIDTLLTHQLQTAFENIVGKEEIACNQHFLLLPQCFLLTQKGKSSFNQRLICPLQMPLVWSHPKCCCLVKG